MPTVLCPYCMTPVQEGQPCPCCGRNHWEYTGAAHHLPAGTVLVDRYRLGAVLGEGGFGITYLAVEGAPQQAEGGADTAVIVISALLVLAAVIAAALIIRGGLKRDKNTQ